MKINFEVNEQVINNTQITLTDLNSELWAMHNSACGMVWDEMNAIANEIAGVEQEGLNFEDMFDNLCEKLCHQMSFYDASYLALPYMMKLLDKKIEQQDFKWQLKLIASMGMIVMTDITDIHNSDTVDAELIENFNNCITVLVEKTKQFIMKYLQQLVELEWNEKSYFYVMALAILDDMKAAYALTNLMFNEVYVVCGACEKYNEDMPQISDGQIEEIEPAELVIDQWDGRSLNNTYLWYSNFLYLLGDDEAANALTYYYGIYTCPECGEKAVVMDLVKKYFGM